MTEPEQAPRNAGELFTQCQRRFSLTPEEVPGLLGFADTEELKAKVAAYSPAFDNIERGLTLRSGRVLRPQGNLDEALAEAEQKAWEALDAFRLGGVWSLGRGMGQSSQDQRQSIKKSIRGIECSRPDPTQ